MSNLDPEPWACTPMVGSNVTIRHDREHEGYVEFAPRPEYEQDPDKYPDEVFSG